MHKHTHTHTHTRLRMTDVLSGHLSLIWWSDRLADGQTCRSPTYLESDGAHTHTHTHTHRPGLTQLTIVLQREQKRGGSVPSHSGTVSPCRLRPFFISSGAWFYHGKMTRQ